VTRPPSTFRPLSGNQCYSAGGADYGTVTINMADLPEDAGQIALDLATTNKLNHGMKIVHNDATLTLDVPTTEYFYGPVLSFSMDSADDPDGTRMRTAQVACNGYLRVARHSSV
jgi:hypothetical protein